MITYILIAMVLVLVLLSVSVFMLTRTVANLQAKVGSLKLEILSVAGNHDGMSRAHKEILVALFQHLKIEMVLTDNKVSFKKRGGK